MDAWAAYLVKRREFLMSQIRYLATGDTRFEETTNGERSDVTAEWLDSVQSEYAEISQILIDCGIMTEAQAIADAAR